MFFHAGELEQDLSLFALKHLNVGRHYAESVDTVAEHVGRGVVYAVLGFALEFGSHGAVIGSSGGDHIGKHDVEVHVGVAGYGAILGDECLNVVGFGSCCRDGIGCHYGAAQCGVVVVACHGFEHVAHVDLQRDVHAAFEVETETHAPALDFIVGVAEINGFLGYGIHVVLVGGSVGVGSVVFTGHHCGVSLALLFDLRAFPGERQIEHADDDKEDGDNTGHYAS